MITGVRMSWPCNVCIYFCAEDVGHLLLQCRELGIYVKGCLIMSKMYTMA